MVSSIRRRIREWRPEGSGAPRPCVSARPPRSLVAALAVLAVGAQGCLSGHLLDAARRRERVIAYREAFTDGSRLLVRYTAEVTNDAGEPVERHDRWATIALDDLRAPEPPAVEAFPVGRGAPEAPRRRGQPVPLWVAEDGTPATALSAPALQIRSIDGRHVSFVFRDASSVDGCRPFYSAALTRVSTNRWFYPLLPLTLAVDAVADPVLLLFAPAVIVVGE